MARWSIHALLRPGLYELMAPSALLSKASAWCQASPAADLVGFGSGQQGCRACLIKDASGCACQHWHQHSAGYDVLFRRA